MADTDIDGFLALVRRETTGLVWLGILFGALLFVLTPVFTVYLPVPTLLLPAALRNRHAERVFSKTPYLLRQSMYLVKMYACICWGQHESVRSRLGVDPYPVDPGTFRA